MERSSSEESQAAGLHKVRRHVRILADLGKLTAEFADLNRFLNQAVWHIARAVDIDHVKILKYRPQSSDLLIVAGLGWKEGVVGHVSMSTGLRSPPGRSFQTGQPVSVGRVDEQDEVVFSHLLKDHGIVSLVNVPILIDGAAWGVLEVDSTVPRDFSEDTIEFLTAAGALIGSCIYRETSKTNYDTRIAAAAVDAQHHSVLLSELQHRVKNNFQLIIASIAMQKRRYDDKDVHGALDHIADRINAISLAHEQLQSGQGAQTVKLADYVRALCASIGQQRENVDVEVQADELELTIDRAVPLGLILNEIATNCLKHAFDATGGRIDVRLVGGIGYGEAKLTVSDNGKGMHREGRGGSGLKLVEALARQIGGTVHCDSSERGTAVTVVFPLVA